MTTSILADGANSMGRWSLTRAAVVAAFGSAAINATIFAAAAALGIFAFGPFFPARTDDPMTLGPILLVSVLAAPIGVGAFALLRRVARRPLRVFTIVAALVLALSFVPLLMMPSWSSAQVVLLALMHVVVAACTVWCVRQAADSQGR